MGSTHSSLRERRLRRDSLSPPTHFHLQKFRCADNHLSSIARQCLYLAFPCPFHPGCACSNLKQKRSDARRAAPQSKTHSGLACSRVCFGRLVVLFEAAQPQQIDRAAIPVDQAHTGMPATRKKAQDRNARDILARTLTVEIKRKMLPEIAFAHARLPMKVDLLGFENPVGKRSDIVASKLHPKPVNKPRIGIAGSSGNR